MTSRDNSLFQAENSYNKQQVSQPVPVGTEKEKEQKRMEETSQKSLFRRVLPLMAILAFMGLAFSQGWHHFLTLKQLALNLETLRAFIAQNYLTAVLLYTAVYVAVAALSIPGGVVVTIAGGLLFGWFVGTLATVVGATIGATMLFLAAKTSLGDTLKEKAGPWIKDLQKGFDENAMSYMFFLRLVPAFPFWLVNLAPALLGVKLGTYVFATFFGIIPGSLAFTYVGEGLESVILAQKAAYQSCLDAANGYECSFELDASSLVTTDLIIAFILLSVVSLLPVLIKRLRSQRK